MGNVVSWGETGEQVNMTFIRFYIKIFQIKYLPHLHAHTYRTVFLCIDRNEFTQHLWCIQFPSGYFLIVALPARAEK